MLVQVVDGIADALLFDDGGELRYYEHMVARAPRYARFQHAVGKVWPWFAGGCHPDRMTGEAIARAGFVVE